MKMEDKNLDKTIRELQGEELENVTGGEQRIGLPKVGYFFPNKSSGAPGDKLTVTFRTENTLTVHIYINGECCFVTQKPDGDQPFAFELPFTGYVKNPGTYTFILVAQNVVGDANGSFVYTTIG